LRKIVPFILHFFVAPASVESIYTQQWYCPVGATMIFRVAVVVQ
jgi:hypothetical protein